MVDVVMASRHGHATVVLECPETCQGSEFGKAEAVTLKYSYPLKVLIPEHTGNPGCKWIYPITFGGGLVGGDYVDISVETKANACGLLTSQESTKVYHCEGDLLTRQNLTYTVGDNSLLCVIPDYCVCYRDANFFQKQKVQMTESGNIVLIDWLTCGRIALEEKWAFKSYKNSIEISVGDEVILKDNVHLHNISGLTVAQSMRNFQVMGNCIILGKKLKEISNTLYKQHSNPRKYGEAVNNNVICSVSTLEKGGVSGIYLRFLASNTLQAYSVIKEIVAPLLPVLGSDPFNNKY